LEACFLSAASSELVAKTLRFRSSEPIKAKVKLIHQPNCTDDRQELAYPAKTPPASTKQALRPSFHQNIGLSGLSSGSSGFSPAAIKYSCPAIRFVGEARANNFESE
jgi:hypothetical protein